MIACAGSRCGNECVDWETSVAHCGACGMACPTPEHATPTCSGGTCGFVCKAGHTLCGAECVQTSKDPQHCGVCDMACETGPCKDGVCENFPE